MLRAAALLAWFSGLGFGLPCIYAIWYLADRGHVWTFLGFPTYGGEPFEGIGFDRRNSPTALAAAAPGCLCRAHRHPIVSGQGATSTSCLVLKSLLVMAAAGSV